MLIDCSADAATSDSPRALEPAVIFEVAVTSQAYDLGGKPATYFRNPHVQHYVVVLPAERRVVYFKRDADPVILGEGDVLSLSPLPEIDLPISDLLLPA